MLKPSENNSSKDAVKLTKATASAPSVGDKDGLLTRVFYAIFFSSVEQT